MAASGPFTNREHPPPEMQRAARQGDPNCISNPNTADDNNTNETEQAETALGAALRAALARKAMAR